MGDWVELSDAIGALRRELATAKLDGAGEQIRFELGPVEMEFALEVRTEGGGEAGVKFGVVSIGAKGSRASTSTHRLTLTLHPKEIITGADGGTVRRSAEIADDDD